MKVQPVARAAQAARLYNPQLARDLMKTLIVSHLVVKSASAAWESNACAAQLVSIQKRVTHR